MFTDCKVPIGLPPLTLLSKRATNQQQMLLLFEQVYLFLISSLSQEHHAKFITKADSDVSVTSEKGLTVSLSTEDTSVSPLKESSSSLKITGSNIIKVLTHH